MEKNLKAVGRHKAIKIPRVPEYKGTFAKVYFGIFDERSVAVKKVDEDDKYSQKELEYLRNFEHDNIVRYLFMDTEDDDEFFYIVLEKCDCTLRKFIDEKIDLIPPLEILWPLCCGLSYLHEDKNLVHRDLKPCNVLMIKKDKHWIPKISDFGISKSIERDKTKVTQTTIRGTIGYQSPEALRGEKLDQRADIFSLGIIFFYVLSEGSHPYKSDPLKLEYDIKEGKGTIELGDIEEDAKSLIMSMIAHERENRMKIYQVMAHHLFWNAEKRMSYIQEVSDLIVSDSYCSILTPKMEEMKQEIVGDWRCVLYDESPVVKEVFEKMKRKQKDGLCDLLRNIRNLRNHYQEKSDEFKQIVGKMPEGVMEYFTSRFPKLLPFVYDVMKPESEKFDLERYYNFKKVTVGVNLSRNLSRVHHSLADEKDQGYANLDEDDNHTLVLRKYQKELAEVAIDGHNSLIVAPTGSGKTAVLTGIIQDNLSKNKPGHIIFLVPKTALAHQQHIFLSRYLPCSVDKIIGETVPDVPPGQKILDSKVTVLTPRILIDELKREDNERYVNFKDISMLLFDECHNANKKHDFKQILDMYSDFKATDESSASKIQIIGVTASPGVGKGKDRNVVKNNLLELMANLHVTIPPITVKRHLEELKTHQNKIDEFYVRVPTEINFANEIIKVMVDIEESIKKITSQVNAESLNKIPTNRSEQAYEKWTEDVKSFAKLSLRDEEYGRVLITYAEHLKMYNFLLQLKDLVPNAMNHANKMVTFQPEGFENKDLKEKNEFLKSKSVGVEVPMLDKLFGLIKKEFDAKEDTRCIVFVKRKLTALSLEECMNQDEDLEKLKAKCLMGTHNARTDEVMTKVAQDGVIKAFADGETKIIIATSVAEEGIDIKKCNLVIMYNYVTGEVGRIQRKGRGRASGSKSILITTVGSDHLRQEENNRICAKATEIAIKDVTNIPTNELVRKIEMIQRDQAASRKRMLAEKSKKMSLPQDWEIICGKCKNFLTVGDRLREIEDMHVIVQDPAFDSRVIKQPNECKKGPHVIGTADFLCNNPKCRIKVALEMVYHQARYPTLSIKKILIRKKDGTTRNPKRKMNLPFQVIKMTVDYESDGFKDIENIGLNNEDLTESIELNEIFSEYD